MNQVELKKRQVELGTYFLSMISFLILGNLLGESGVTYVAMAFECFLFVQILVGGKVADTLGKMIRGKATKGQYKNAARLKKSILIFEFIISVIACCVFIALAELLGTHILHVNYCVAIMVVLAPTIVLRTMVSVLLGYFQAEGTELPTVIACIMRQIVIFLFSLLFIKLVGGHGEKVSVLLRQEKVSAMYGGMGIALAVTVAEALVLLFLFLVYRGSRGIEKKGNGEGMRMTDTFGSQTISFASVQLPVVVAMLLSHLPVFLGMLFYCKYTKEQPGDVSFGLYYGKFLPVIVLLAIPSMVLLIENCAKTVNCVRKDEQRFAKQYFLSGFHMAVSCGAFFSVLVMVMAKAFADLVGGDFELVSKMFQSGGCYIFLMVIGFVLCETLSLMGGRMQVIAAYAAENLVFVISVLLWLNGQKVGILALIYASILGKIVECIVTGFLVLRALHVNVDWLQHLGIPIVASAISGLVMLGLGKAIIPHLGGLFAILIDLVVGIVLYMFLILLTRNFREQELNYIPGGKWLLRLGQLLRVY